MRKYTAIFLCLLAAPAWALDLTPLHASINADGFQTNTVFFQDGKKRVFIAPPNGWTIDGSSSTAALHNPKYARSSVVIALSPKKMMPADEAAQKTLREAVLGSLPKGSVNAAVQSETVNPLLINGWKSYELTVGYELFEASQIRKVLLVKLNNFEELQVIVAAPQTEFAAAAGAAIKCLNSWHKE
jgi:hypothetical protein